MTRPAPVPPEPRPLLYVFTEEGGSREDCSVYYARYVVVLPGPGQSPHLVQQHLAQVAGITPDGHYLVTDPEAVASGLRALGHRAYSTGTSVYCNEY